MKRSLIISISILWENYSGIILTILFVIASLIVFNFIDSSTYDNRIDSQKELKGQVEGYILTIENKDGYVQDFDGASKINFYINVYYAYEVKGKVYKGVNILKSKKDIYYNSEGNIIVKFSLFEPEKSLIKLKE